jgi:hypothetical protein
MAGDFSCILMWHYASRYNEPDFSRVRVDLIAVTITERNLDIVVHTL